MLRTAPPIKATKAIEFVTRHPTPRPASMGYTCEALFKYEVLTRCRSTAQVVLTVKDQAGDYYRTKLCDYCARQLRSRKVNPVRVLEEKEL